MKLINSYIFLSKDKKRNQDNKLIIKSSITSIFEKFFNADVDSYLLGEIEDNPEKLSKEILDKLGHIAEYNGRTKNKELEQMIKARITAFEQKHGEISIEKED